MKQKKLYHPNARNTSIEVDEDRVDEFTEQGWRKTPAKFAEDTPEPDTTTSTPTPPLTGEDK